MKTPIPIYLATTAVFLFFALCLDAIPPPAININRVITAQSPLDSKDLGLSKITLHRMVDLATRSTYGSEAPNTVYYRCTTKDHDQDIIKQIKRNEREFQSLWAKTNPSTLELCRALATNLEYTLAVLQVNVPDHPSLKLPAKNSLKNYYDVLPNPNLPIYIRLMCVVNSADVLAYQKFGMGTPTNAEEIKGFLEMGIVMQWNLQQELSLHLHDPDGKKRYEAERENTIEYLKKVVEDPNDALYGPVESLAMSYLISENHFNDKEWKFKISSLILLNHA